MMADISKYKESNIMATVYGANGLTFGAPTLVSSSLQVTNLEATNASQQTEVQDRKGEILGVCVFQTNKHEITGEYVYQGTDLALNDVLDLTALDASLTGSMVMTEISKKTSNSSFRTGGFKALAIGGINFSSGSVQT